MCKNILITSPLHLYPQEERAHRSTISIHVKFLIYELVRNEALHFCVVTRPRKFFSLITFVFVVVVVVVVAAVGLVTHI